MNQYAVSVGVRAVALSKRTEHDGQRQHFDLILGRSLLADCIKKAPVLLTTHTHKITRHEMKAWQRQLY